MPYLGEILSVSAAMFWAVGVILFRKSGERMTPMALNLFKNVLAVAMLLPTIPLFGEELWPEQGFDDWILLITSGVVGIAVADTFFFVSLQKLGAGLTAVVDTSYTPILLGLSLFVLGEEIGPFTLVGGALIMGALLLGSAARPEPGRTRRDIVEGVIIGVVGIALMAVGIVMVKPVLNHAPLVWATTVRLVAGSLALVPMILASPRRWTILRSLRPDVGWRFAVPAAISGTYFSMIAWLGGMKYTFVSRSALLNQLSTIFIFALAIIVLREPVTWRRAAAIALAFSGAVIVIAG